MPSYETETTALRQRCLAGLRQLGVSQLEADYSGYGDSGQVDNIRLQPKPDKLPDDLAEPLDDLIWRIAYQTNPGFEINSGGNGAFEWSVADNRITIEHVTFRTSEDVSFHEDI